MFILLDIDGVMIPEPCDDVQILPDGFKAFNFDAAKNLSWLIGQTDADIILTSNHRVSHTKEKWVTIFNHRGIAVKEIDFINDLPFEKMMDRATELRAWVLNAGSVNYVIIDDDYSLTTLPPEIQQRCVMTDPLIGLDTFAANKALGILLNNRDISAQ
jgi:hypothetical protein